MYLNVGYTNFCEWFSGLYYDGRVDSTVTKISTAAASSSSVKESHYSIVAQPEDAYLGFCSPNDGTGKVLQSSYALLNFRQ